MSAPLLFLAFGRVGYFPVFLFGTVFLIGVLVGLELPLLMRILKDQLEFKDLVSRVLAFDYLGALVASVLFPLLLVPQLGLIRTSLVFGMLNAAVGLWATWLLRPLIRGGVFGLRARGVLVLAVLAVGAGEGRRPDQPGRGRPVRRRDRPREDDAVPADRRDPGADRVPAVPERPPPVRRRPTSTATTRRWSTRRWRWRGGRGGC